MSDSFEGFSQVGVPRQSFVLGATHALKEPALILFLALISFGVIAKDAGFSNGEALLSTAVLWALPAQIAHAESVAVSSGIIASVITVFLSNLRFFPMIITLLPQLNAERSWINTVGISHLVTATSWAWCIDKLGNLPGNLRTSYFFGFSICCWCLGILGTAIGLVISDWLPQTAKLVTLYIAPLYMLLLLAGVRGHRLVALLVGGGVGVTLYWIGVAWYLPLAAIAGGVIGFLVRQRT